MITITDRKVELNIEGRVDDVLAAMARFGNVLSTMTGAMADAERVLVYCRLEVTDETWPDEPTKVEGKGRSTPPEAA